MQATASDASEAYASIQECSDWLRAKGISQWDPVYPRQRFDRDVAAGEVWVWRSPAGIDATVTLSSVRPDYYPRYLWKDAERACYVCRFAIARRLKGAQLGVRLLGELERDARVAGIATLRLDVSAAYPFLTAYYVERGFEVIDRADIMGVAAVFLQKTLVSCATPRARRIVVKGGSGAGKSTMGLALSRHLGVPYVELDALHHGPSWTAASASELQASVLNALDDDSGWVVDGNYESKLGTLVLDRAELIVWLDLPLRTKLQRLVRRTAGRWLSKQELWNGNRETFKDAFWGPEALFPWAIRSHFRHRGRWPGELDGRTVVRLSTAREADVWLADFCRRS
jgi:GNAT superfamily N-acetyltransferase